MNKPLLPIITFKDMVSDGKRVETAYFRIFEIARKNIMLRRMHFTQRGDLKALVKRKG